MSAANKITESKNKSNRLYSKGSMLFVEGEKGSGMFIVRSGKVRVLKKEGKNSVELTVLESGSVLGELTFLDNSQPYNVTAEVVEDAVITVIDKKHFDRTIQCSPSWIGKLVESLVKRFRDEARNTSDEIVRKSMGGVVRVLLLLDKTAGYDTADGAREIDLETAREKVLAVMGISVPEIEKVLLHLTIKGMILICKNSSGTESIRIKDHNVLLLYMNYLRAHQCGSTLTGENFTDVVFKLARAILDAGKQSGRKNARGLVEVEMSDVKTVFESQNGDLAMTGMDQLIKGGLVANQKESDNNMLVYNQEFLLQLCLLKDWITVFKEEIIF
ncbi:MAG: Crp/Fnr family transcriptional regulator [Fibrobacter sp.]|nr:Crp/Fnr family transcriptional regulator [Fibrobacter sp.]